MADKNTLSPEQKALRSKLIASFDARATGGAAGWYNAKGKMTAASSKASFEWLAGYAAARRDASRSEQDEADVNWLLLLMFLASTDRDSVAGVINRLKLDAMRDISGELVGEAHAAPRNIVDQEV